MHSMKTLPLGGASIAFAEPKDHCHRQSAGDGTRAESPGQKSKPVNHPVQYGKGSGR